ncbi:6-phosphogluconolactonase [Roseiconus nitratireducens]|uniref:6-phosphogluconolactonase n=1 Tax=Roseiconus nitratireducens TaxID=2605748 RepID=A0A5M6D1K6_9BACT|nr:6-phosphogluconolactonase [Roseiconus nitratireducens]KAA5540510.1 6-phosphogluconolactonase [Roseiconus nitratireducens]
MNAPFEPFPDVPTLQQAVTDAFCDLVNETVAQRGTFNVSLSGGSTPKRVYELLSQRNLPWDAIHWFWGDERNVPPDHPDSNFRMVKTALLDQVPIPQANQHPVPVNVDDPDDAARQYEQTLREHFQTGSPEWDLVLLGMGDDAHTASLFPGTDALSVRDRWFVQNWVPKFDAFRYTLTYPAIESGRNIWFLITGQAKRDALQQVLQGPADADRYPSQKIKPTRWFVSADACQ